MAQRRLHYESAFESYLRSRRIPYIAIDEARKTLLPPDTATTPDSLKSFDFVVYGDTGNLLIDVKGRLASPAGAWRPSGRRSPRLESWVTEEDIRDMSHWETLFGAGFEAAFAFMYAHDAQPPDAQFDEVFADRDRWYALRIVRVRDYARHMTTRSPRWRTLQVGAADFQRIGGPLCRSGIAASRCTSLT